MYGFIVVCTTFVKGLFPKKFKYFFSRENKNIIMYRDRVETMTIWTVRKFRCVLWLLLLQEWKPFSMGKFPTTLCALIYTLKLLKISARQNWKIDSSVDIEHFQVNTFNFSSGMWYASPCLNSTLGYTVLNWCEIVRYFCGKYHFWNFYFLYTDTQV